MWKALYNVSRVMAAVVAVHQVYKHIIEPLIPVDNVVPNTKVDAVLDSLHHESVSLGLVDEAYAQGMENALYAKGSLNPQLITLAVDMLRLGPSAYKYRFSFQDGKKVLEQVDRPRVAQLYRDRYIRHGEVAVCDVLGLTLQKGVCEAGYDPDTKKPYIYFFGSSRSRFVPVPVPDLTVERPSGEKAKLVDLLIKASQTNEYRLGKPEIARIFLEAYPWIPKQKPAQKRPVSAL